MKKALFLLLILAVTGSAFAQDPGLVFSGGLTTGIDFKAGDGTNDVIGEDNDAGVPLRFDLNGTYDAGDWGLTFRYRTDIDPTGNTEYPFLRHAYGWFNFLDGMIALRAGIVNKDPWGVGGGWQIDDPDINGDGLFQFEVKPIDGLSLGFALHYPNGPHNFSASEIAYLFAGTSFGAKYKNDAFWVSAAAKLFSKEDNYSGLGQQDMEMTAGFGITAVENLSIRLAADIDYMISDADTDIMLELDVGYQVTDPLKVSLQAYLNMCDGFQEMGLRPRLDYDVTEALTLTLRLPLWFAAGKGGDPDKIGFQKIGVDLRATYSIGDAYIMPQYSLRQTLKDFGKELQHTVGFYFGWFF